MKYKPGDVVMKKTGGNKMTIVNNTDNYHYKCYWFIESKFYENIFKEEDIVTLDEYKRLLIIEEREDKLNKILS